MKINALKSSQRSQAVYITTMAAITFIYYTTKTIFDISFKNLISLLFFLLFIHGTVTVGIHMNSLHIHPFFNYWMRCYSNNSRLWNNYIYVKQTRNVIVAHFEVRILNINFKSSTHCMTNDYLLRECLKFAANTQWTVLMKN